MAVFTLREPWNGADGSGNHCFVEKVVNMIFRLFAVADVRAPLRCC